MSSPWSFQLEVMDPWLLLAPSSSSIQPYLQYTTSPHQIPYSLPQQAKQLGIHAVWTDLRVFGNWPCFIFLSLRSSVHSPGSGFFFFFFALVIPGWTSSSLLRSFLLGWPLYPFGSDEFRQAEVGCGDHWGKHLISR